MDAMQITLTDAKSSFVGCEQYFMSFHKWWHGAIKMGAHVLTMSLSLRIVFLRGATSTVGGLTSKKMTRFSTQ